MPSAAAYWPARCFPPCAGGSASTWHFFPTYQTVYGALSAVPIFLVWMYLSWAAVLVGAVVTASLSEWRDMKINPR